MSENISKGVLKQKEHTESTPMFVGQLWVAVDGAVGVVVPVPPEREQGW